MPGIPFITRQLDSFNDNKSNSFPAKYQCHTSLIGETLIGIDNFNITVDHSVHHNQLAIHMWCIKSLLWDDIHFWFTFCVYCPFYFQTLIFQHGISPVWIKCSLHVYQSTTTQTVDIITGGNCKSHSGFMLGIGLANARRCYIVTASLTGEAYTQNGRCHCSGTSEMEKLRPCAWVPLADPLTTLSLVAIKLINLELSDAYIVHYDIKYYRWVNWNWEKNKMLDWWPPDISRAYFGLFVARTSW